MKTKKTQTLNIEYVEDACHGWIKVPIKVLRELNILEDITCFSYIDPDRKHIWLEEDADASLFGHIIEKNKKYKVECEHRMVDEISIVQTFDNVNKDFLWRAQRDLSM